MTRTINFGTKAETLERLRPLVKKSIIGEVYKFTVEQWNKEKEKIINELFGHFGESVLIVRSSALSEDSLVSSNAGRFCSVLGVRLANKEEFIRVVNKVVFSYEDTNLAHQVFVQCLIENVEISGVVFTRDIDTSAPYLIFNYDDFTGSTDSITSGRSVNSKTLVVYRNRLLFFKDDKFKKICESVLEIENLIGYDALDIEFGYKNGKVHIFQVRPLAGGKKCDAEQEKMISLWRS